jgi:hypothetical protein
MREVGCRFAQTSYRPDRAAFRLVAVVVSPGVQRFAGERRLGHVARRQRVLADPPTLAGRKWSVPRSRSLFACSPVEFEHQEMCPLMIWLARERSYWPVGNRAPGIHRKKLNSYRPKSLRDRLPMGFDR